MDHGKRAVSTFPIATGEYYKYDYSAGIDISMYKNIKVPTSYMAAHSDFDFIGNYDEGRKAGLLHVADHHISPGKKQWTWGNADFGRAWDRNLTDEDGPYIELMTGVFADNQPDFTWLKPYEEKTFTQYFMPYKQVGRVKNATKDAIVNFEIENSVATLLLYTSGSYKNLTLTVEKDGTIIYSKTFDCSPLKAFSDTFGTDLSSTVGCTVKAVTENGYTLVSYTGVEEKIEKICETTIKEDVRCLAGVPSWFLTVINKILEKTGKNNLHEVWPNLELFIHGGISFTPYREQYNRLLPDPKMKYLETYNASEGFFGLQDDPNDSSMLLMLDYGVYYEFMPTSELGKSNPRTVLLEDVKTGVNYALIISTNSGLWRYMIGDTIQFTSTKPYKFKITGRTKLFINAFGEEVIIDNATEALNFACRETGADIYEFTAAPIFMGEGKRGAHEWLIEFKNPPADIEQFADLLDSQIQKLNSDYEAKRMLSLERLHIQIARPNLFNDWLKEKGKLGGQHKVPRLWNDRTHIDELLSMNH